MKPAPLPATAEPAAAQTGTVMPAEWARHQRTWMAFPPANDTFGPCRKCHAGPSPGRLDRRRPDHRRYEPVTVVAHPRDATAAREWLGAHIDVVEIPLDDAWLRDSGPSFTHQGDGSVAAVDWTFNGWGAQHWAAWDNDQHVARSVAGFAGHVRPQQHPGQRGRRIPRGRRQDRSC